MDDSEIREIAERLMDAGSSSAQTHLHRDGHALFLTANREGLLRLAGSLVRASVEPIVTEDGHSKIIGMDDLISQSKDDETDCFLVAVLRRETVPETDEGIRKRRGRMSMRDCLALLGCASVAFFFLFFFAVGLVVSYSTLTGKP